MTREEILDFADGSPLRRHERDLQGVLDRPELDDDKGAEKIRLMFARYLRELWEKRDPAITALELRETYPHGEPHTWLSMLSCYGAFKPDFAYYEAQRPSGSIVLLRKRSERLTSTAEWFHIKAPIIVGPSEVAHVLGCDAFVVMRLKSGDRILLNHGSMHMNPHAEFMEQYRGTGTPLD